MDITKSKVQNFSRYFLRACYSIAPNGPVFIYFKIIWAFKKIVRNLRKMIILQFIFIFKSLCFIVFHFWRSWKKLQFFLKCSCFRFFLLFFKNCSKVFLFQKILTFSKRNHVWNLKKCLNWLQLTLYAPDCNFIQKVPVTIVACDLVPYQEVLVLIP